MRRFIILILTGGFLAAGADLPRREVFGAIGLGKHYDDEGSLGSGLNGGGGFGYRLSPRFGVEAEVNAFRTRREFSSAFPPFQAHGAHVMGNGLLYLNRSAAAQAYLLFGAGLLHAVNEADFAGARVNRSGNGFALGAGFGVKAFITPSLSLRPEIRLSAGSAGGAVEAPFTGLRFSMGLGYHW